MAQFKTHQQAHDYIKKRFGNSAARDFNLLKKRFSLSYFAFVWFSLLILQVHPVTYNFFSKFDPLILNILLTMYTLSSFFITFYLGFYFELFHKFIWYEQWRRFFWDERKITIISANEYKKSQPYKIRLDHVIPAFFILYLHGAILYLLMTKQY